jgi:hypothetical protein
MLFTAACRPSPDKNVLGSPKAEAGEEAGADVAAACVSAIDGTAAGGRTGAGGAEDSGAVVVVDADAAGVGLGCKGRRLLSGH